MSTLEEHLALINANTFLKEFSFARNQFTPHPGEGKEFADHVIWIDDLLIALQLKERPAPTVDLETERKWLARRVIGKATRQVRDTMTYLAKYPKITLENQRGRTFQLERESLSKICNAVVYRNSFLEQDGSRVEKFHRSRSVGFIHLIGAEDYAQICSTLVTPVEIVSYLVFREAAIEIETPLTVSEPALLGHYIAGKGDETPHESSRRHLENFVDGPEYRQLLGMLRQFEEHMVGSDHQGQYAVLREFAKLDRFELQAVHQLLAGALRLVQRADDGPPRRFQSLRTQCVFMVVPTPDEFLDVRRNGLSNYTAAAKYSLRAERAIGISVARDGQEILLDWYFDERPWEEDPDMERRLAEDDPFPQARLRPLGRYQFRS